MAAAAMKVNNISSLKGFMPKILNGFLTKSGARFMPADLDACSFDRIY
jgi:hypothetical protein